MPFPSNIRSAARLTLAIACLSTLLACTGRGPNPTDLGGAAQSLGQTVVAGGQQAGTALAGVPGTATILAGTVAAEATKFAPTGQALASQAVAAVAIAATAAAQITPPSVVDEAAATAAIRQYAQDILGVLVGIVHAGGLTTEIQNLLKLPQAGDAAQAAVESYAAILDGGVGSVSYGSGSITGNLTVDINSSSVGAFTFDNATAAPRAEAEALALALQTFPNLSSRAFTSYAAPQGFAWTAQGQVPGYDKASGQASLVAEAILLAVTPAGPRRSVISVVVGKGDFAGKVIP